MQIEHDRFLERLRMYDPTPSYLSLGPQSAQPCGILDPFIELLIDKSSEGLQKVGMSESASTTTSSVVFGAASLIFTKGKYKKWSVGPYNKIKGTVPGMDAHHAGQSAAMKKFIPNYNHSTAPAILVPKLGHTVKGPHGIVSRVTGGFTNARQVLARDIFELRRVYGGKGGIPNSSLQKLIQMNKTMFPSAFQK